MSNLDDIRGMAKGLSEKTEKNRTLLLRMGCDPVEVGKICASRQQFLHAIQTETPPPDVQKILNQMDKEDAQ